MAEAIIEPQKIGGEAVNTITEPFSRIPTIERRREGEPGPQITGGKKTLYGVCETELCGNYKRLGSYEKSYCRLCFQPLKFVHVDGWKIIPVPIKIKKTTPKKRRTSTTPSGPSKRKLTEEEEISRMEDYKAGYHDVTLSELWGLTESGVWSWRKTHGLKPNPSARERKTEERFRDYHSGMTDRELAEKWKIKPTSVADFRYRNNLPVNRDKKRS